MVVDVERLEGWLNKDKKLNGYRLGITGTQTRRWFRVQYIDGGGRFLRNGTMYKNLVLCYFKHKSAREPHGWMFLRDVTNVREVTPKCFVVEHPSRSYVLRAVDPVDHRRWVDGLQQLVEEAKTLEDDQEEKAFHVDSVYSDQKLDLKPLDNELDTIMRSSPSPTVSSSPQHPPTKYEESRCLQDGDDSSSVRSETSDHQAKEEHFHGDDENEACPSDYKRGSNADGLEEDDEQLRTAISWNRSEEKGSMSGDDRPRPETKERVFGDEAVSFIIEETAQQRKARERAEARCRLQASSQNRKNDDAHRATMRRSYEKSYRVDDGEDVPEFDDEIDLAREDEKVSRVIPVAPPERRKKQPLKKETGNENTTPPSKQQHVYQETRVPAPRIVRRGAGGDELDVDFGPPRRKKGRPKSALARRLEQGRHPPGRNSLICDESSDEDLEKTVAAEKARLQILGMETIRQESLRKAHQVSAARMQQRQDGKDETKVSSKNARNTDGGSTNFSADRDFATAEWDDDHPLITNCTTRFTGGIIPDADFLEDWDK